MSINSLVLNKVVMKMGGDNNCYIDRLWTEAKAHGMTIEEFGGITEDKKQYFCNDCDVWDCYVKRRPY